MYNCTCTGVYLGVLGCTGVYQGVPYTCIGMYHNMKCSILLVPINVYQAMATR